MSLCSLITGSRTLQSSMYLEMMYWTYWITHSISVLCISHYQTTVQVFLSTLKQISFIKPDVGGKWNITNLGAILLAMDLERFKTFTCTKGCAFLLRMMARTRLQLSHTELMVSEVMPLVLKDWLGILMICYLKTSILVRHSERLIHSFLNWRYVSWLLMR